VLKKPWRLLIEPICAAEDAQLGPRKRRAISADQISDRGALCEAKVPERFADLDGELKNWKP
jgi:hypothetical protein